MEWLHEYWYFVGGVIGLAVFGLVFWRRYRQGKLFVWNGKQVAVIALLIVAIYPLGHIVIANSDAFEVAEAFVRSSPDVLKRTGPVQKVSLSWLGGSFELFGDHGSAEFTLNVEGDAGSVETHFQLKKDGNWEIRSARMTTGTEAVVLRQ